MNALTLILELFGTFFVIGLLNFGGGNAMLSLIQTQVVTQHGWLTESTFTDIVAISQSTPGPIGINCATYVGYQVLTEAGSGIAMALVGSFIATLAVVLPSFVLFLALVRLYDRHHKSAPFNRMMHTLTPAVAGLIGAAAIILMFNIQIRPRGIDIGILWGNFPDAGSWLLFAAAFVASFCFKANPIWLITGAAALGAVVHFL